MTGSNGDLLSRREREVMDVLYRLGNATVAELLASHGGGLSYSAVRAALKSLREKGAVSYREHGPRYVYAPSTPREQARSKAVQHLIQTFFDGSAEAAAVAILATRDLDLGERQMSLLESAIASAREAGR
jgi:predicted transcriptional regulator